MLISVKNDAKQRYFKSTKDAKEIEDELSLILNNEDMDLVQNAAEKSREQIFIRSKQRLVKKFESLQVKSERKEIRPKEFIVKDPVLNLVPSEIPQAQMDILKLGPKFVPAMTQIPYMDIVCTTEVSAQKIRMHKYYDKVYYES